MSEPRPDGAALTVGFFDGVHRGHQELLKRVRAAADRLGVRAEAVTFDLHSLEVLHGRGPLRTLLTTEEKVATLQEYGLDQVHVIHFTPEFAAQSGGEFVARYLVERYAARQLVVGHDFRFGHNRACGATDMVKLAAEFEIPVEVVERVELDGQRISSSGIRARVAAGDVAAAAVWLGRPYTLAGEVVEGCRLGRQLGFPTANLALDPRKLWPALGVYAGHAVVDAGRYPAVVNLGRRPTVGGLEVILEAHLLDFSGDLYGQQISILFQQHLRAEQQFPGLDALTEQIQRDVVAAREVLADRKV